LLAADVLFTAGALLMGLAQTPSMLIVGEKHTHAATLL
jgi:hypothetical protein